jgi:uracil-DNA glycosylase family protein
MTLFDDDGTAEGAPGHPPPPVPEDRSLTALADAAAGCQACGLWERATRTVFGDGPETARVLFVGEQPGDKEDLAGAPFVGPAGKVLDEGLAEAGIDRSLAYVTNAVKHFKWKPRGKLRLHQTPVREEILACKPWLEAELAAVGPEVLVCLGATAVTAVLGSKVKVMRDRGTWVASDLAPKVTVTVHPSSILRGPPEARDAAMSDFVDDLRVVAAALENG